MLLTGSIYLRAFYNFSQFILLKKNGNSTRTPPPKNPQLKQKKNTKTKINDPINSQWLRSTCGHNIRYTTFDWQNNIKVIRG